MEMVDSRPFPIHEGARIDILDDPRRERFLLVRNRKLQIIAEKIDPGLPPSPRECDSSCDYHKHCWGETSG